MRAAILFGLGTMVAWGLWIVFGNVASNAIDPETAAFVSYVAAAIVTGIYAVVSDASLAVTNKGVAFSIAAGLFGAAGVVSTFIGVSVGSTAIVSTIGGMYFVVAAAIGIAVLGEPLTLNKAAGIGLAVLALVVINQ